MASGNANPAYVSDDEFMALPDDALKGSAEPVHEVDDDSDDAVDEDLAVEESSKEDNSSDSDDASDDEASDEDAVKEEPEPKPDATDPDPKVDKPSSDPSTSKESKEDGDAAKKPEEKSSEPDYKAFYELVTGSFKANGKEMRVSDGADIIKLMQMGANYNRKMAALKPNLKILKTLEKAEISEEKLNFLIDLDRKDPVAISRLIKEAGLDPLDIDLKKGEQYTATNHSANEKELALDEVMDEIRDSPHYNATLSLVATKWDAVSKQAVVDSPQLLKVINDHMASGVYDLISTEMEKERMFGRLRGMSDLQAYKAVGDAIEARNGFAHLFQPEQPLTKTPTPAKAEPDKISKDAERKDKKRAASPPKASPVPAKPDFNPLALSDEEFAKQFDSKFM